ncbi:MAG: biotin transporter BioY [Synergistaceae bacterium]|nr:biotin transporter BioY [Synergistaceae bacterium]
MPLKSLLLSSFFAILTAVSSLFIIPFPLVPMTLQVAVMLLSGLLLGPRGGAVSQAFYVLLGLLGLPVFAGGVGGIQYIFSPTFGFLMGFIAAAATAGFLGRRASGFISHFLACLVGVAVMYFVGLPFLFVNLRYVAEMDVGIIKLLQIGLLPFVIPDVIKACAAAAVAVRFKGFFDVHGKHGGGKQIK